MKKGAIAVSESKSIRLVTAGVVFAAICLPVIAADHLATQDKISFLASAGSQRPPAFCSQAIKAVIPKRDGHLVFRSTKEGRIPSPIWARRERIGQHLPSALVESDQTITERFRQQANRPANGTGGKS